MASIKLNGMERQKVTGKRVLGIGGLVLLQSEQQSHGVNQKKLQKNHLEMLSALCC